MINNLEMRWAEGYLYLRSAREYANPLDEPIKQDDGFPENLS